MTELTPVTQIYESNHRDVVATLRAVADSIENQIYGDIAQVAIVTQGRSIEVFHAGLGDAETAHMLLAVGQLKLTKAVLDGLDGV